MDEGSGKLWPKVMRQGGAKHLVECLVSGQAPDERWSGILNGASPSQFNSVFYGSNLRNSINSSKTDWTVRSSGT
jgi:hypothetical protein